jgi:60 kDa SS-A/Ro ribonucleoprotein
VLAAANTQKIKADLVVYFSDNESWFDDNEYNYWVNRSPGVTTTMKEWATFKKSNPKAKLVCVNLQPNTSTQAPTGKDRLNLGGFNDVVFDVINNFVVGGNPEEFVKTIEETKL